MAETSYPTAGGGSVTDNLYERLIGGQAGDGLIGPATLPSICYADSTGRHVKLRPFRYAIVRGFLYSVGLTPLTLAIAANSSGRTRIDRVVLRLDRSHHWVRAYVHQGAPAVKPVPPALVQQESPSTFWELPVATVTVPNATSGLTASAVKNISYYLAEPPVVGPAAGRPAASPGRIFRDVDNDRVYIGSENGTYQTIYYDTGWVSMAAPSGFAVDGGFKVRLKNGWVNLVIALRYSNVTAIAKTKAVTLKSLPAIYRPSTTIYAPAFISSTHHSTHITVSTAGAVVLQPDGVNTTKHNAVVWANISYPING